MLPNTLAVLRLTGALLYGLWPVALLSAAQSGRLYRVFAAWMLVLAGGLLAATEPETRSVLAIVASWWLPQPWNAGLFALIGLGLGALMYRRRRSSQWL